MIAGRESAREGMQISRDSLASVVSASDREIESLTRTFEELAGQSSKILGFASAIVEYIEGDGVRSVLPAVRALGCAGISSVESRLESTRGLLETAAAEVKLLRGLSKLARSQSGISLRTRVLAMMANIEMGRLGTAGAAFEYLAGELSNFSKMLSEDTDELERGTYDRGVAIEATNRVLTEEAPRLAEELSRIRIEIETELRLLESGLADLASIPAQFKGCVGQIAAQIAGAVAAIQSYDITRQQIEHVHKAIAHIATQVSDGRSRRSRDSRERCRVSLGITIQIHQLRHIRETVASWMSRIRDCLQVMLKVSASNLAGISLIVKEREREILARLAHIDLLESQSKVQSELICRNAGEHSTLLRLIDEQVKKATVTRQTLHLLSLNTIVEAERLGAQANAVLEIGSGISDLSVEWSRITDQSGQALRNISILVERIDVLLVSFSEAEGQTLRDAQVRVWAGLQSLHSTSEFATSQTGKIELVLEEMKVNASGITKSVDVLDQAYRQLDDILSQLQRVKLQLETDSPEVPGDADRDDATEHFSASYTTEIEREVLRAALGRAALPAAQQSLEGNGVELF